MKQISQGLAERLDTGSSSLVKLWTIRQVNGKITRFCDGSSPVFYNNQLYPANPGIEIAAIRDTSGEGYGDTTVTIILSEDGISESSVRYRQLTDATFQIIAVDSEFPNLGQMFIFGGVIGDYTIKGGVAQLNAQGGTTSGNDIKLGEAYSERCRNIFGDNRCKVNIKALEVPFTVIGVFPLFPNKFYVSIDPPGPDEEPDNPEIASVIKDVIPAGSGVYTVPNCTSLTVQAKGAGGGGAYWYMRKGKYAEPYAPGFAGSGPTTFLDLIAGPGGGAFYAPGSAGAAAGGDLNAPGAGALGGVVIGPGAVYPLSIKQPLGVGGNGGLVVKTYPVAAVPTPGHLVIGQQIPYVVGFKGASQPQDGFPWPVTQTDGSLEITARGHIKTLDEQKTQAKAYGSIIWTGGENSGYFNDIVGIDPDTAVNILVNTRAPIAIGDTGRMRPGCANYRSDCMFYNNMKNFRAEPDVPNLIAKPPEAKNYIPAPNPRNSLTGQPSFPEFRKTN